MRFFTIAVLCVFILLPIFSCSKSTDVPTKKPSEEASDTDTKYKKELEEIKKNLKGDIKIKLKKESKGSYSWEITGKDAQEVLKANETLKKRLSD